MVRFWLRGLMWDDYKKVYNVLDGVHLRAKAKQFTHKTMHKMDIMLAVLKSVPY